MCDYNKFIGTAYHDFIHYKKAFDNKARICISLQMTDHLEPYKELLRGGVTSLIISALWRAIKHLSLLHCKMQSCWLLFRSSERFWALKLLVSIKSAVSRKSPFRKTWNCFYKKQSCCLLQRFSSAVSYILTGEYNLKMLSWLELFRPHF